MTRPLLLNGCCCAGVSCRGYERAGFEVWGVDIMPQPHYVNPARFIQADILDVLADKAFMDRFSAVHASPPCFPAGTPVVTARGVLAIEAVYTGDLVLTHQGQWRPVTATMSRQADVYADNWMASTADHPFWSRRQTRARASGPQKGGNPGPRVLAAARPCENCGRPTTSKYGICQRTTACRHERNTRTDNWGLGEPSWVPARSLRGTFTAIPASADPLPVPPIPERQSSHGAPVIMSTSFWWMIGRWLGDGWLRITEPDPAPPSTAGRTPSRVPALCLRCGQPAPRNTRYPHLWSSYCSKTCRSGMSRRTRAVSRYEVVICCGAHEADGLESKLADTGLRWTRSRERTVVKFRTAHKGLVQWIEGNFGTGAAGKTIPGWLLGASAETRHAVLDGYISADGNPARGGWQIGSISTGLAFSIRILATSLGYATSISRVNVPPTTVIEGRTVNQRPWWRVSIHDNDRYTRSDGLHRWVKRRHDMTFRGRETVYDLTVEEDHSFIAWGFAVHNCQRHSPLNAYNKVRTYPDLIGPVRDALARYGMPYVIENVPGAPLREPETLCGYMFPGLLVERHRLFEAGRFTLIPPPHPPHVLRCTRNGYLPTPDAPLMSIHGGKHSRAWQRKACEVMGAPWLMVPEDAGTARIQEGIREICEAIPVAYAEYAGSQLMRAVREH